MCSRIRIEEFDGYEAVYPGRITRGWGGGGVLSLTTGDSWKGCWGRFFVFSVCMYVCVFGRDEVWC